MKGKNDNKEFIGYEGLKQKHKEQLDKFERWAKDSKWKEFGPINHFDWWTFPIFHKSQHGWKYSVYEDDVDHLLSDQEFITNYKRAVELISRSWGWDIKNSKPILNPDKDQVWNGYDIRLRKCGQSLQLFKQDDYFQSLSQFVHYQKTQNKMNKFDQTESTRYGCKSTWPFS